MWSCVIAATPSDLVVFKSLRFESPLTARQMTAPVMSALLVGELGASLTSELPMDEPPMTKLLSKLELLNCEVGVCALLTRALCCWSS